MVAVNDPTGGDNLIDKSIPLVGHLFKSLLS